MTDEDSLSMSCLCQVQHTPLCLSTTYKNNCLEGVIDTFSEAFEEKAKFLLLPSPSISRRGIAQVDSHLQLPQTSIKDLA